MSGSELRIVSLISGNGTTTDRIFRETRIGSLKNKIKVAAVIADRFESRGIQKATGHGVVTYVIDRKQVTGNNRGEVLIDICKDVRADIILQNGWLSLTPENFIHEFEGKIFNQHPGALDPENKDENGIPLHFGGKGMHGLAVHAATLKFQELSKRSFPTEATIHCVNSRYDEGGVVYRAQVVINEDDTPETLAQRVSPVEHEAQIEFLNQLYDGRLEIQKRGESLIRPGEELILYKAKGEARLLYPNG